MNLLEFIQAELGRLHNALENGVADLAPEDWYAIPGGHPKANTIAFNIWHYVRTEDNIVRFILQNRRPTVWMEGGWAERLGMPPVSQGTGMSSEDAQALRIGDLDGFKQYTKEVWASTADWLTSADEAALQSPVTVRPLGEMPAIRAFGQVCMTHGFTHLGDLELSRTLLGKGGVIGI